MRNLGKALAALAMLAGSACNNSTQNNSPTTQKPVADAASPAPAGATIKIGYVLHGLNDFTQVIKRGAEDAGKATGVEVEVVGPSSFEATEAISQFEGMIQKKKNGLVVIPMPGEVWVKPIKEATTAAIPVVTANITSAGSDSTAWFGQDEYQSGVTLAVEIRKMLDADHKKSGTILVGICKPGVAVLEERYKGFKKGMEGSAFTLTDPKDVGTENTANYAAWENQAGKAPQIVAAVGLCSMDVPNLAKLKTKTHAAWLIAGYDLNQETLDSIKAGTTQLSLGQNPYLQGYLPVLALAQFLKDHKPLPKGWVNVGTEIVTKANVDSIYPRETDRAAETKWYADYAAKNFTDMAAMAKPLPATH